jgi:MFS family permease
MVDRLGARRALIAAYLAGAAAALGLAAADSLLTLYLLAVLACGAAGKVAADHAQVRRMPSPGVVEARLEVASLGVELGVADAAHHRARRPPRVDADTGVALFSA